MLSSILLAFCCSLAISAQSTSSSKRGLVAISSPEDADIWDVKGSKLTWYYNYAAYPTSTYDGSSLQFVPMLSGAPKKGDTKFSDLIGSLINGGTKVPYVLSFNEPDLCDGIGGACVDPGTAAQIWIEQIEPLKHLHIKLGAPSTTGSSSGTQWLGQFFGYCDGRCTPDFLPLHWYGDFEGLASYVGSMNVLYKNMSSIWITEFAEPGVSLQDEEAFVNQTLTFLDNLSYIERYAYFGSFRSNEANSFVGPNVAMLDNNGGLTEIGATYIGPWAVKNLPNSSGSGGAQIRTLQGWMAFTVATILYACT